MAYHAAHDIVFRSREDLAAVLSALITADAKGNSQIAQDGKISVQTVNKVESGLEWVDEPTAAAILSGLSRTNKTLSGLARPSADAGADVATTINTAGVALDGSALSLGTPTYAWSQTAGDAVTLSDATAAAPTFTAPGTAQTLTFELVVTDGETGAASRPDTVDVVVAAA